MRIFLALMVITLASCSTGKKKKEKKAKPGEVSVVTSKHDNGNLRAEVSYKDGKQNGMSKSYDREGHTMLELPYVNGKREGLSKKYYAGGKQLYQTTEYKDDKMHGFQTKFRDNGNLMSEARYENSFPCLGLKEYLLDNTIKKKYPQIKIVPIDKLEAHGTYTLEISMSDKVRSVKYYSGKLNSNGCVDDNLYFILQDQSRKTGQLKFTLPPGGFLMEEVNIVAVVETLLGNSYVTQRSYNLAIDN